MDKLREDAVKEAARNAAVDDYFKARPQLMRTRHEECLVEAGFNAAWQACAARTVPEGMLDVVREIVDLHSQTGTVLTVKIDELAALLSAAPEGKK